MDNLNNLKIVYKILNEIMINDHLTKDNSFVRVKNYISQKICDELIKNDK